MDRKSGTVALNIADFESIQNQCRFFCSGRRDVCSEIRRADPDLAVTTCLWLFGLVIHSPSFLSLLAREHELQPYPLFNSK